MLFFRKSIGLEISHSGLRMVVVDGKRTRPALVAFADQAFPPGMMQFSFKEPNVTNPDRFVSLVSGTYAKLLTKGTRVSLSLPDSVGRIVLLDLQTRFKNRQEGMDIIRWKLKNSFPFDLDSIHFDYETLGENEAGGMNTLVSIISKKVVTQYEELLLQSGLEPSKIDFSTFNLCRLFAERLKLADHAAFFTLHGGVLSITVFLEGTVAFYRAKDLPAGTLSTERLFREVNNSLLVYRDSHPGPDLNEVFYTTSSQESADLSTIIAEVTTLRPIPLRAVDFITLKGNLFCDGKTLQQLSPALGAATRNL